MRGNPISEFISDDIYFDLASKGFLNERAVRDFYLKKKFNALRHQYAPQEIFSILQQEFPYICTDTIRKIIYTRNELDQLLESDFALKIRARPEYLSKTAV